jgi:hypothetical protein
MGECAMRILTEDDRQPAASPYPPPRRVRSGAPRRWPHEMKTSWIILMLALAGCAGTSTVMVPVIEYHHDHQMHVAGQRVGEAMAALCFGQRPKVYRFGDGVAPRGTQLQYAEKAVFVASEDGTFVFVDLEPECDWAHDAVVYFIPQKKGAQAMKVHGGDDGVLPAYRLIAPDGQGFDSQWQELKIKRTANTPSQGMPRPAWQPWTAPFANHERTI